MKAPRIGLIATMASMFLVCATQAYAHYPVYGGGVGGWTRAVTEFGDYMRWLGQLRLDTARAEYVRALAAQEEVRAHALARAINTLEKDLYFTEKDIYALRRKQAQIESRANSLNPLLQGRINGTVLVGVDFFVNLLPADVADTIGTIEVPALDPFDFELQQTERIVYDQETRQTVREVIELTAFPGGNVWELLAWLRPYNVKVRPGSEAYKQLVSLRGILLDAGAQWHKQVVDLRTATENRKTEIWGAVYAGDFGLPERELP